MTDIDVKYEFDIFMQQTLLGAMLKDIYFLKQSAGLVKPGYFQDNTHSSICSLVVDYFEKYKQVPKIEYLEQDICEKFFSNEIRRDACLYELKNLYNCYEVGLENREYLTDKITEFSKIQEMRIAISNTVDILNKKVDGKWEKIYNILNKALNVDKIDDKELDYFGDVEERYIRIKEQKDNGEVCTTGFDIIDAALESGGMSKAEIFCYLANTGVGKSTALCRAAIRNVLKGKKVLYISMEMSPDKISTRCDAIVSGIPINELIFNSQFVVDSVKEHEASVQGKSFLIKQYPGGSLTIPQLRAYISQKEMEGHRFDLVVLDYINEMANIENIPLHTSLYYTMRSLRGLAVEMDLTILTAAQTNRIGKEEQENGGVLSDKNIGSSYDMVRPLDGLWSMNQNMQEKLAGVLRMFVSKHRSGKSGFMFYVQQMANLDIVEISKETYFNKMNAVASKVLETKKNFVQNG